MGNLIIVVFYCLVFKIHTWVQMPVVEQPVQNNPAPEKIESQSVVDGRVPAGDTRQTVLHARLFHYCATWINR
jgi:hypothetical protein